MSLLKKKSLLIVTVIGLILLIVVASLGYAALWGNDILVFKVNPAVSVVDRVRAAEKLGGSVTLTEADLNGIMDLYVKQGIGGNNYTVQGMYSKLSGNNVTLFALATVEGFRLLLTSEGTFALRGNTLIFTPSAFRLGKLPLPPSFVLERLKPYAKAKLVITNQEIEIAADTLPFDITALSQAGDKITVGIAKNAVEQQPPAPAQSPTQGSSSGTSTIEDLLQRANRQLANVYSGVNTPAEKDIIGKIRTVVGKMIENPAYLYQAEASAVKAQYNGLTTDEKSDLKDALLTYMDTGTLKKIKTTFGL